MEEDIGDISLKQIIREAVFGNKEASASVIDHHWMVERFEKAKRSAPKWLVYRWVIGESPKQIARETGQPIEDIYRMLKDMQKAITKGTEN
jgi:hypothetical protein